MIRAYDSSYLFHAQRNIGHMIDFAVNTCEIELQRFFDMFLESNVCAQIEDGNPAYLVGKTGCELAREVVLEIAGTELPQEDVMYMDKSPEYWLGWSLAYYVWLRNCKFRYVLKAISAEEMLCMYDTLHEADIEKYVEAIDKNISGFYTCTALV